MRASSPFSNYAVSAAFMPLKSRPFMKRVVIICLLAAAAICVAVVLLRHGVSEAEGLRLAPAGTVLFVDLPDIPRTRERWKQASLHQLAQEPEVQAFLQRPKSAVPALGQASATGARLSALDPQEAFFALTSIKEEIPRFI